MMDKELLPSSVRLWIVGAIALASSYQFTQSDAKTADHFFKGFPSYWNIVAFYLILFTTSPITNAIILITCVILVFVPIKYVYPSRLDYLTELPWLRKLMLVASMLYGVVSVALLWTYPNPNALLLFYTLAYISFYLGFSLYRTFVPLQTSL